MNQHLPRWITASLHKHFDANKGTLPLYIEGYDRLANQKDKLELRINGPDFYEPSKGVIYANVEINVLVTCIQDQKDAHKIYKSIGIALAAADQDITIKKYGNGDYDDQTSIGCMILDSGIVVTNFGLVQGTNTIMQSTVEGSYRMTIE